MCTIQSIVLSRASSKISLYSTVARKQTKGAAGDVPALSLTLFCSVLVHIYSVVPIHVGLPPLCLVPTDPEMG